MRRQSFGTSRRGERRGSEQVIGQDIGKGCDAGLVLVLGSAAGVVVEVHGRGHDLGKTPDASHAAADRRVVVLDEVQNRCLVQGLPELFRGLADELEESGLPHVLEEAAEERALHRGPHVPGDFPGPGARRRGVLPEIGDLRLIAAHVEGDLLHGESDGDLPDHAVAESADRLLQGDDGNRGEVERRIGHPEDMTGQGLIPMDELGKLGGIRVRGLGQLDDFGHHRREHGKGEVPIHDLLLQDRPDEFPGRTRFPHSCRLNHARPPRCHETRGNPCPGGSPTPGVVSAGRARFLKPRGSKELGFGESASDRRRGPGRAPGRQDALDRDHGKHPLERPVPPRYSRRMNESFAGTKETPTSAPRDGENAEPGRAWGRPELLAPAGDWECARAAVENGADAIYFGLDRFNARMRAANFTEADLPALMDSLHERGVRGYVTVNTLVFEDELPEAERYLRSIIAAGVDAAIVQDVGICRLIRQISADFPVHASTQMTITSAAGVDFARELGCTLVVLARECSIGEIAKIRAALADPLPLEVFVHGALCVAYSGQCLTSEALGGRSANRGECAQACRLPYDLLCDGTEVPLGDRRYLLSPQDLAGIDLLAELAAAGVASLKIEGRLKSPEYVANITRVYRQALDRLSPQPHAPAVRADAATRYALEMAFSRGLATGWLRGIDNQELVHARFGKKRGVYLGEVVDVRRASVLVRLQAPVVPGDGVGFDAGRPEDGEVGGRVFAVHEAAAAEPGARLVELVFGRDHLDLGRVHSGDRVWKTSDPELSRAWRQSWAGPGPRFTRPIDLEVHGQADEPLLLVARDELGHVAAIRSAMPLIPADRTPLDTVRLRDQLGRLGGTPFHLRALEARLEGSLLLPVSELNRMRRAAVAELRRQRSLPPRWQLAARAEKAAPPPATERAGSSATAELVVLVRSLPQLEAACAAGITTIHAEFENPKTYRAAVPWFRTATAGRRGANGEPPTIFVAPPRVYKTGEEWTLQQVRSADADGYLVRNYDHLRFFASDRCVGDFSLNVANHLAAEVFLERGLERITASYDLDAAQLRSLLRTVSPACLEVTVHQHMPMFHMEHCVFCAFLTTGKDYRDCGRPCDRHELRLRDRVGAAHPIKADAGCRNTVFNAQAQTGAEHLEGFLALGLRWVRLEFLDESPEEVTRTIGMYRQLLRGELTGAALWRHLRLRSQLGVTRGQLGTGPR